MMVGRPLSALFQKGEAKNIGRTLLEVEGMSRTLKYEVRWMCAPGNRRHSRAGWIRPHRGGALFGTLDIDKGRIVVDGQEVKIKDPRHALSLGLIYLPKTASITAC